MRIFLILLLAISSLGAEPTDNREWTSTVGSKITAKATGLKNGKVTLVTSSGRTLKLALKKLSQADQNFLKEHFKAAPMQAVEYETPSDLGYPLGGVSGPIQATEGSSYFIYLPKSLAAGAEAPIFFWTGSSKSNKNSLHRFYDIAELTGIVLASSVESKNGPDSFNINYRHTKACLEHIGENFPVAIERVFFSGGSGGGASSWYNASKLKCLGALPIIGYIPRDCSPPKSGFYYVAGGAWDFNRYLSAQDAKRYGKRATHRLFVGGHAGGKKHEVEGGLLWLYTRHLYENRSDFSEEAARFEPRFHQWLTQLTTEKPGHAHYWTDHLLNTCKISGDFGSLVQELHSSLSADSANTRYLAGRKALAKFSEKQLAQVEGRGSKKGHTTDKIQKAAAKLQEEFADVPEISKIGEELGKKTN